jgi:CRP-like cAMP-binding protein
MTTNIINQAQKLRDYELFLMGQPIMSTDQPGEAIFILIEGEVIIQRNDEAVKVLKPGDFLDETLLKSGYPAIAKTNCQLVPIDQKIAAVLEQYPPDFRVEAMHVMVERLTWRVSPPVRLAIRPQTQSLIRNPFKPRSKSNSFSVTVPA